MNGIESASSLRTQTYFRRSFLSPSEIRLRSQTKVFREWLWGFLSACWAQKQTRLKTSLFRYSGKCQIRGFSKLPAHKGTKEVTCYECFPAFLRSAGTIAGTATRSRLSLFYGEVFADGVFPHNGLNYVDDLEWSFMSLNLYNQFKCAIRNLLSTLQVLNG